MQRAGKFTSTHIKKPTKAVKLRTLPNKLFLQQIVKEKEKKDVAAISALKVAEVPEEPGGRQKSGNSWGLVSFWFQPTRHDSWAKSGVLANH